MGFSENLIGLRKKQGLSQEALGNKLNVTRQTVSKWELAETTPEMSKLVEMSEIFDISVDELIGKAPINSSNEKIGFGYEFKSKTKIKGVPLVHINIGYGLKKAKGIVAIGNIAEGVVAIGVISMGIISFGALSFGLLALGGLSLGLLFSAGGLAVGAVAIGGLAIGLFSVGGCAVGIYAIGGGAFAKDIACGGYASGHIAIGDKANGTVKFLIENGVNRFTADEVKNTILKELPNTPKIITSLFYNLFSV